MHAIELEHHELIDEEQEHFVPAYLDQLVAGGMSVQRSVG